MVISSKVLDLMNSKEVNSVKANAVKVTVDVRPGDLIGKLADVTLQEMYRMANNPLSRELDDLAEGSVLYYFKTLVYLRVLEANGQLNGTFGQYRQVYRSLAVPSFMYQLLICIGKARDESYNIVFEPRYSIDASDLLAVEELVYISELMDRFPYLDKVNGLPKGEAGELSFMALHHVNDVVTGYRKDHPTFGFLASFFEQQELNEVTGNMHRIIYGDSADYQLMISTVVRQLLIGGE